MVSGRIGGTHYYFCIQVWWVGVGVVVKREERVGSDGAIGIRRGEFYHVYIVIHR